jgi:GxxExxY protein
MSGFSASLSPTPGAVEFQDWLRRGRLMDEYPHEELSRDIIGAAMQVHGKLRPGLREKTYERALVIELQKRHHTTQQQSSFDVYYDEVRIDTFTPDLIVDQKIIVDPKCATDFTAAHISQMIGYLAITGLKLAILLNFKGASLQWKRVVR